MVRQGWLAAVPTPDGRGLPAHRAGRAAARGRLRADLPDRRSTPATTPGTAAGTCWSPSRPASRSSRERLGSGLAFLGYAQLTAQHLDRARGPIRTLGAVLDGEAVQAEAFFAAYDGQGAELAGRAWDLAAVAAAYERFEVEAADLLAALGDQSASGALTGPDPDRTAFATRSQLVHEWRKFLFLDPGLPDAVLPAGWPGHRAARLFDRAAGELLPAATRYVDACLGRPSTPQTRSQTRSDSRSKEDA